MVGLRHACLRHDGPLPFKPPQSIQKLFEAGWQWMESNEHCFIHNMLPSLIRRSAQQAPQVIPYNVHLNPYRAKRLWPPDFAKLSPKQQFRLERKYKRRAKLKWARPRWTKFTKIVQMSAITCMCPLAGIRNTDLYRIVTLVYGVLFMDWSSVGNPNPNHKPFEGVC
jgi:hypothetical protein